MPMGLGMGLGFSRPVVSSGAAPAELWPQPTFAASTGLTFASFDGAPPSVSGGQLLFGDGSQDGYVNSTAAIITQTGTYRIRSTSANAAGAYGVKFGDIFTSSCSVGFDGNTTSPETHDLVVADVDNGKVYIYNNYAGQVLDDFSVTKIA